MRKSLFSKFSATIEETRRPILKVIITYEPGIQAMVNNTGNDVTAGYLLICKLNMIKDESTGIIVAANSQAGDMTLRVSYTEESSHMVTKAVCFVLKKMGYLPLDELPSRGNNKEVIALNKDGKRLLLAIGLHTPEDKINNITFHTDDCLRDYHNFILSGIEFISRPEYTSSGLAVDFIDDQDNLYTLLEERIYTEC